MKIDEALYQIQQRIKMHELEQTTSVENEREKVILNYINKLQDKIDKAIEYINKNAFDVVNSEHKSIINVEELLNILQGDNK